MLAGAATADLQLEQFAPTTSAPRYRTHFPRMMLAVVPRRLRNTEAMWAWELNPAACATAARSAAFDPRSRRARATRRS
jgi:hypothetical protein